VSFGANYGRDTYGSFQRSRNANPPPDPTWTDPTRDWNLDNDDKINTAGVFLDLLRAFRNTDIRFGYDFSDSDNSFVHGGPRIVSLTAANQFIPLPNVENTWQRLSADVQYLFNSRIGVGVGYYFEKLDVVDFNTLDTNGPVGFSPRDRRSASRLARRSDPWLRQPSVYGQHRVRASALSLLASGTARFLGGSGNLVASRRPTPSDS
jgi:hypothetical protein